MTVEIIIGDVLRGLWSLPDESVHCVVVSPPYWGLRDYGVEGQIGLEPTLGKHIEVMVAVFQEVRRVLRKDGTVWLNYGDCYAAAPNGRSAADCKAAGNDDRTFRDKPFSTIGGVLKPKDLCMMPNRLAIAMQEDGWWVRGEIIWGKPNPMPESIADRPATSHEKIFLFSKSGTPTIWKARDTNEWNMAPDFSERIPNPTEDNPEASVSRWQAYSYYYDAEAVRQNRSGDEDSKSFRGGGYVGGKPGSRKIIGNKRIKSRVSTPRHKGHIQHTKLDETPRGEGRNLRNYEQAPLEVWNIATRPFRGAHFATFPPELAERCIRAGCPEGGVVLDPFAGAGTVGLVADRLGRDAILIEINKDYAEIAKRRIEDDAGMFSPVPASIASTGAKKDAAQKDSANRNLCLL